MKIYLNQSVWDASLDRIRRLYDEFDRVTVNISGGKDSDVILNLTLLVAEEKGRLPLDVMFLDQEAEWDTVIDHIRLVMHDPRVRPWWLQIPFKLFNATSEDDPWLYCWHPDMDWIRPKEPDSIQTNTTGTDRFAEALSAFADTTWPHEKTAQIAGVRAEESPARLSGLTSYATYRDITWGVKHKIPDHFTFYPIYDWSLTDVWKAIHDNGWPYTRLYDFMYQHGVPLRNMRVSNVHHETAIHSLTFMQEIESDTWDRVVARVGGVNAVKQVYSAYQVPRDLPFMFDSWKEYRDYLLDHLIADPAKRDILRKQFASNDLLFEEEVLDDLVKTEISALLVNDLEMTKLKMFHASHGKYFKKRGRMGKIAHA